MTPGTNLHRYEAWHRRMASRISAALAAAAMTWHYADGLDVIDQEAREELERIEMLLQKAAALSVTGDDGEGSR